MEYEIDINSDTWLGVKQIIESHIRRRTEQLVAEQTEMETAKLRGSIQELRNIVNAVEKPILIAANPSADRLPRGGR